MKKQLTKRLKNGILIYVDITTEREYFSITGSMYNSVKLDSHLICGGCIHDEILKYFPELRPLVNIHLADLQGRPLHAIDNGFYQLGRMHKDKYCEYYRVLSEQYEVLKQATNKMHFAELLGELNVFKQWAKQAQEALDIINNL